MNAQVLLVDDDIELAGLLRDYLARVTGNPAALLTRRLRS